MKLFLIKSTIKDLNVATTTIDVLFMFHCKEEGIDQSVHSNRILIALVKCVHKLKVIMLES